MWPKASWTEVTYGLRLRKLDGQRLTPDCFYSNPGAYQYFTSGFMTDE